MPIRNIHNIFETTPIEVIAALDRTVTIMRIRTLTKAKEHLKLNVSKKGHVLDKIVFSKTLNRNVILKEMKEKWQSNQNIVLVEKSANK